MRIRLDLAYDGAGFHGWAAQPGLRTVQGELETALATVLRHDDVAVTCAGRTDTGVHARGQVTHLDLPDVLLAELPGPLQLLGGVLVLVGVLLVRAGEPAAATPLPEAAPVVEDACR